MRGIPSYNDPIERITASSPVLEKFERILSAQGIHAALQLLNSRTPHRFTGVYLFDDPMLRNVFLVDSHTPAARRGDDAPLYETYCSIVGRDEAPFSSGDTLRDLRLREHPARESVIAYCGVLLRDSAGAPIGTLCHFDLLPCDVAADEILLMESASPLLARALGR